MPDLVYEDTGGEEKGGRCVFCYHFDGKKLLYSRRSCGISTEGRLAMRKGARKSRSMLRAVVTIA